MENRIVETIQKTFRGSVSETLGGLPYFAIDHGVTQISTIFCGGGGGAAGFSIFKKK